MSGEHPLTKPSTTSNPIAVFSKMSNKTSSGEMFSELMVTRHNKSKSDTAPTTYTQEDLYQAFAVSGFDFVGQCSSGYGVVGIGGGVNFGVDIGKAILPGFLTAGVSVGLSGEKSSETLVMVNRQPNNNITDPVIFITAKGKLCKGKVNASACVGLKASIKINATGQSSNMMTTKETKEQQSTAAEAKFGKYGALILENIAAEASATATLTLTGQYEGEYIRLRDPSPSWYTSFNDAKLKDLFHDFTGYGEEEASKSRILAFFNKEKAVLEPLFDKLGFWASIWQSIKSQSIPWQNLMTSLEKAESWLNVIEDIQLHEDKAAVQQDLAEITEAIEKNLQKSWLSRRFNRSGKRDLKSYALDYFKAFHFEMLLPDEGRSGFASLADWKQAIIWVNAALNLDQAKRRELLNEIAHHRKIVIYFKNKANNKITGDSANIDMSILANRLTYLNLWGHQIGGDASAECGLNLTATPAISLGATAGLTMGHAKKWSLYRFQQYAKSKTSNDEQISQKIYTQDAIVSYDQTKITGKAALKISAFGKTPLKEHAEDETYEPSKDFLLHNSLTYQSSHLVWQPTLKSVETPLLTGSGLRFGCTLTQQSLKLILEDESDSEVASLLTNLATMLNISTKDLKDTLSAADYLKDSDLPVSALLIESVFKLDESAKSAIEWVDNCEPKLDKDIKKTLITAYEDKFNTDKEKAADKKVYLQSIRIRYRIADSLDTTATFKLGIPIGIFKPGIELSSASRAGASGIVDLYTHWFGDCLAAKKQPSAYPESSVPATTLLHQ